MKKIATKNTHTKEFYEKKKNQSISHEKKNPPVQSTKKETTHVKKTKNKNIQIASCVVSILLILVTFIILGTLFYMDVLPFKYILLLVPLLLLIIGCLSFFLFHRRIKIKIKIASMCISIFLVIVMFFGEFYLCKTLGFLDQLSAKNYKIETYHILVLKDSPIKETKDLNGKNMGYNNTLSSGIEQALKNVENFSVKKANLYEDMELLIQDLYQEKIDAIILEESYKSSLEKDMEDFSSKVYSIYDFEIKVDIQDTIKHINVTDNAFTIFISGMDKFGSISSVSNSDVNMLITINPKSHQVLLTHIPRDYYVQLHGTKGSKDKLTHAGTYGIDMSIKTIEDLLDIDINYYVKVNFSSLINIIDALKGVDVYSAYSFDSEVGYYFNKGYNHVNGAQALAFARSRHLVPGGDRGRGKNQQAVIEAIIRRACSPAIITNYSNILKSLEGSFETNMPSNQILDLIKMQLDKMPSWNITTTNLDGTGDMQPTYSYGNQKLWVMQPDEKTVENAKEMIQKVIDGKILDSSYGDVSNVKNPTIVPPKDTTEKPPVEEDKPNPPEEDNPLPSDPDDPITGLLPDNPLPPEENQNPAPDDKEPSGEDPDDKEPGSSGDNSNEEKEPPSNNDSDKTDSSENATGDQIDKNESQKPSE